MREYELMKYLFDINSQYKNANNIVKVMYGYMTPQEMIYEECIDRVIKKFFSGSIKKKG